MANKPTEIESQPHNSTYKKLAVQWLNEALCFVSSSVVADSLVLRNRQLLLAPKRYGQVQNRLKVSKLARESPFPYLTILYH